MKANNAMMTKLDCAIKRYRASGAYKRTCRCLSKHFFLPGSSRCSFFDQMTLKELAALGARQLTQFPSVGSKKIEGLIGMFESLAAAYEESENNTSEHGAAAQTVLAEMQDASRISIDAYEAMQSHMRSSPGQILKMRLVKELQAQLEQLPKSDDYQENKDRAISLFWPEGSSCSKSLEKMTLIELTGYRAEDILFLRGVGIKKIRSLVIALSNVINSKFSKHDLVSALGTETPGNYRTNGDMLVASERFGSKTAATIGQFYAQREQAGASLLALGKLVYELPNTLEERELGVLLLSPRTSQREVADLLQLSESRVSQITTDAYLKVCSLAPVLPQGLHETWMKLLTEAAVPEVRFFDSFLDRALNCELQHIAGRLLLQALGAKQPLLFHNKLQMFWSNHASKLQVQFDELAAALPLPDSIFRRKVEYMLPGLGASTFEQIIAKQFYYAPAIDIWAGNSRELLYSVLSRAEYPMTTLQLAQCTGLGDRNIRGILSRDPRVSKHGHNRWREYSIGDTRVAA
ncbi:hypothetical protein OAO01_05350 [Oligoflexia bacterium]|nr:hypothetical protein [Oligoflexia bacterium]